MRFKTGPFFIFIKRTFSLSLLMRIGLISDTHNQLPSSVFSIFKDVELILHAGDIGSDDILIQLQSIAPVRAIYGNMDTFPLVSQLRRIEFFEIDDTRFCMIHAIRSPKSFGFELFKMKRVVNIVVYGHTHTPSKTLFNKVLFINPGSASSPRHGLKGSVAILKLENVHREVEIINI